MNNRQNIIKVLILILAVISTNVSAYKSNLIVPVFTAHTNDTGFNNNNYGLGVEVQLDSTSYSIVAVDKNSYNKSSVYFSANYRKVIKRDFALFAGVTIATGYDELSSNGIAVFPSISAQYYNLRISTTYPSLKLLCNKVVDSYGVPCSDVISIQYIQEF